MRLINFRHKNTMGFGIQRGDLVYSLTSTGFARDIDFFAAGDQALKSARTLLAEGSSNAIPLQNVKLLAPVLRPGKILCVGLNYRDHAIESHMTIPEVPTIFLKLPNAVIGPDAEIVLPRNSKQPDYEAELAVVIGTGGKNIRPEDWEKHVIGFTILNDVSARDVQLATTQWTLGKSFDTFAPMGPAIVTLDEIADPHSLDISLSIEGEELQRSNTKHLIFKIPELIAHISAIVPLNPGDVISTGTPAGVGLGRKPPRWLRPGERVTIEIEGIGTLSNKTIAEPAVVTAA